MPVRFKESRWTEVSTDGKQAFRRCSINRGEPNIVLIQAKHHHVRYVKHGKKTMLVGGNGPMLKNALNRRIRFRKGWKHVALAELTSTSPVPEPFEHGSDPYPRSGSRHSPLHTPVAAISYTLLIS